MKRKGWLVIALIAICALWAQAQNKYDIKSGVATLDIVSTIGNFQVKMTKIVYFDDYGLKQCEETYSDGKLSGVIFTDGKDKISLNPKTKIARKLGAAPDGMGMRVDLNEMGTKKDIDSGLVKRVQPMIFAGQSCEVIQVNKGSTPDIYGGWHHLLVYLKTGGAGSTTELKPTKLEANAVVPKEKFQIPAGYTVQ